jgi:iron complex outermembrane receptor protein
MPFCDTRSACGRTKRWRLLFTTALGVMLLTSGFKGGSDGAHAAEKPRKHQAKSHHAKAATTPAAARSGAVATPHPRRTSLEGGAAGEAISVSASRVRSHGAEVAVTREVMDRFVAGTNPMQILAMTTPGANFASSDAFGLDTAVNTFYVRGFNQTQLGATLDGIPMGSQGFTNQNGLSITQAMIQDDIGGMTMSQGAGALDSFSAQNLGGAMTYFSSDPKDKAGGKISQTFGSYNAWRTYGRADSGILNSTGTKFYASFARTDTDRWKGYGYQSELQADAKLVQPVSDRGRITALFTYGNFTQSNYLGMTKNM